MGHEDSISVEVGGDASTMNMDRANHDERSESNAPVVNQNDSTVAARAIAKYVRVSVKRSVPVAAMVRGLPVLSACDQLVAKSCKSSRCILKVLRSAMGNAKDRFDANMESLVVSHLSINKGPVLKRAKARNKGGRSPIRRPMAHISVCISSKK